MAKELEQELGKREPLERLVCRRGAGRRGGGWRMQVFPCFMVIIPKSIIYSVQFNRNLSV